MCSAEKKLGVYFQRNDRSFLIKLYEWMYYDTSYFLKWLSKDIKQVYVSRNSIISQARIAKSA